jgi:hypothetical protein
MSSLSRSIRRKQEQAKKKAAKKKLKRIGKAIQLMPESCFKCQKSVDKANLDTQLDWHVEIDNQSNMRLTCPECKGAVE